MLEAAGYAVIRVLSGAAAIEHVTRGDIFDVVLSDVVMEGMSGLELAAQLRERYPKLPIVLMTGFSKALLEGSSQGLTVLSKPFRLADVVAALKTARLDQGNPALVGQRVS
jgi:CheY-like chemotaxis protein